MNDYFSIKGGKNNKPLELDKLPLEPEITKNKAYGFLSKINKKLDRKDIAKNVTLQNAIDIKEKVETVRDACEKKNPKFYKLQAKFNPFSKAYKIEKLSGEILGKIGHVIHTKKSELGDNQAVLSNLNALQARLGIPNTTQPTDAFAEFEVPDQAFKYVHFLPNSQFKGYVRYSEHYDKIISNPSEIPDHRNDLLLVPLQIDRKNNAIRILTEDDPELDSILGPSIKYNDVYRNAQNIRVKLQAES